MLFNNLASIEASTFTCPTNDEDKAALALKIDATLRERAPSGWKGDQAREAQVLNALFPLLARDREATLALFELVYTGVTRTKDQLSSPTLFHRQRPSLHRDTTASISHAA